MHQIVCTLYLNRGMRPLCKVCGQRPALINTYRNEKTYYLSRCSICSAKKKKIPIPQARWLKNGYKKKMTCDLCGFRAKYASQTIVYHSDGNLHNSELRNLKSICLNCVEVVKKSGLPWKPGDLEPDL